MNAWKEVPFTDSDIDQLLLQTPTELTQNGTPPDLATALATSPFSTFHIGWQTPYFNDYYRLLRTGSDKGLQRLIQRNNSLAKAFFPSMCEHKRFAMVDWIIESKYVRVNTMLPDMVRCRRRYACPEQTEWRNRILAMLPDNSLTPSVLSNCLAITCESGGDAELFEVFLNDNRVDPSYNNNYALALAALHGSKELVLKLCADERVRACKDWTHVVWNACRQRDESILRTILEQPNAKFSRLALRYAKDEGHDWILQHPKYNAQLLVKKKPTALIRRAMQLIDEFDHDKAKRLLKVALLQLEGKEPVEIGKEGQIGNEEEEEVSNDEEYEMN